jgi:anti-sigma-K factor RskA
MSSPDQSKGGRSRDEVLAGEYVLGVLSQEDRQKVERRMRSDRQFAAIVNRWEQNLSHFNDEYEATMPSADVFPKVERRLFGEPQRGTGLWHSLLFWRGFAFASLAFAAFVAVFNSSAIRQPPRPAKPLVANLAAQDGAINLVASYDSESGRLRVAPVAAGKLEEKSLELWLIRGSEPAQALGVLPQTGEGEFPVAPDLRGQIEEGTVLAVSVEPFGGSSSGKPTGAVIASGPARLP